MENKESKLHKLRTEKNISLVQLAKESGVHRVTLSYIESFRIKSKNISLLNAVKIAKVLDCNAEDLLDEEQ